MHPELFKIPGTNIIVPSYGAMVMIGFLIATWWMARRSMKVKADPDIALNLGFIILITSTIGARAFYVIHYWESKFAHQPAQVFNLRAGGMEFYGGLIASFIACALYLLMKRTSLRLFADLVTPSLLFAMGVGRIGCFLFGCCWGGPCPESLPWAVHFPFASPPHQRHWTERQTTVPAELIFITPEGLSGPIPRELLKIPRPKLEKKLATTEAKLQKAKSEGDEKKIAQAAKRNKALKEALTPLFAHFDTYDTSPKQLRKRAQNPAFRSRAIHPSQIYGAIGPILLAILTSCYFYRRKRHGMVMVVGFMLYSVQRFVEEIIRGDNPHDTFGLTASQAVSIAIFLIALTAGLILLKLPLRSAKAIPYVPKKK